VQIPLRKVQVLRISKLPWFHPRSQFTRRTGTAISPRNSPDLEFFRFSPDLLRKATGAEVPTLPDGQKPVV
jgi:hypothetical protein